MNTDRRRPRALVVDDDEAARLMLRVTLEDEGFAVEEAEDGRPALALIATDPPELILLDVMMPEVDGFAVCRAVRERPATRHIPIVMMTGLDDVTSINHAYELGATDFITKPINHAILSHRLRYILRAKALADDLRQSEARLANAGRIARLGYWQWDVRDDALEWSPDVAGLLGQPDAGPRTTAALLERVHPEDRAAVRRFFDATAARQLATEIEHRLLTKDGEVLTVHQHAEPPSNQAGGQARVTGTIQDISERRRTEREIEQLASYDQTTGLANRKLLHASLAQALAQAERHQRLLAVLWLDIDDLKRVNDTLGYATGDAILREVAKRLTECLRAGDVVVLDATEAPGTHLPPHAHTIARINGDEFVVLLTEIRGAEDAAVVARRIRDTLHRAFTVDGAEVVLTSSMGISTYPEDGRDPDTLLKCAGSAMGSAKTEGRDCYHFYTEAVNARAFQRFVLETNLRKALEQRQLRLYYQPKLRAADERVVGMEALVRWEHPDLGMVSPAEFIPVAEETGLIVPIGEWILRHACQQVKAWQAEGLPPLSVAVNLSAAQFKQANLVEMVRGILEETGLDPRCLELEITESLLLTDVENTIGTLNALKSLGLGLSIDDFGTGYSSLSYLKRFPVRALKIDQSFVRDVADDADDAAIVRAVIALAHSLRLEVIAEGVENVQQLAYLRAEGCDDVQGYHFSRPLKAEDFAAWVLARNAVRRTAVA